MQQFDVIIVGQGYAGLKAGAFAAARGLKAATVEGNFPGGLIMSINELEPVPAGEVPSGPELTGELAMANMDNGLTNVMGEVEEVRRTPAGRWEIEAGGETLSAPDLVIASGARLKRLGVPGEDEFRGRGVSECADCDGPMFMGKEAVVVGGGDSAFQEAVALTHYADKVTILMRGSAPKARPDFVAAASAHPKIALRAEASVSAIEGDTKVTGVRLQDGELVPCSVVFVFAGLQPNTEFLGDLAPLSENGCIAVNDDLRANAPGLWAIGAAREGYGGELTHATQDAERVIAAIAA